MTNEIKDYGITISNLSEADIKCLDYTTSSVQSWLNGVINSQIEFARNGILNELKEYCFANNITPASTADERIIQAFDLGLVKTAAQNMADMIAIQQAEQTALLAQQAANAPHVI
jgi:hypothetical protein